MIDTKYKPARIIVDNYTKNIGWIPSVKMGLRQVQYESIFERNVIHWLEYVKNVTEYYEQPLVIPYIYNGIPKKYYPDFKCILSDGSVVIIECKYVDYLNDPEVVAKLKALKQYCIINGFKYKIITDQDIYVGHRANNLEFLSYYKAQPDKYQNYKETICRIVETAGEISINSVLDCFETDKDAVEETIYYMIYKELLDTDIINNEIGSNSLIKVVLKKEHEYANL